MFTQECMVGPVPDFHVVYRNWKKASNPLAAFNLKVPHCMRDQYKTAELCVRKGDILKLTNFKVHSSY